jgi:hypothetical protein
MYDAVSGKPIDPIMIEKEEIRTLIALSGKKMVFPEDLPLPRTYETLPEMHYSQGVLFGSEGASPNVYYGEGRCCPCGASLNFYNPGPLCGSCQLKIFDMDPKEQELHPLHPFVIPFLRLFWPDIYKERVMTERVINPKKRSRKQLSEN